MKGQIKTGTTMLDNIKEFLKNLGDFLIGSDDEIQEGYTDVMDIPEPTIENYPEEREFITKSAKLEKIFHEKSKKIVQTSRNSIEENEIIKVSFFF